MKGKIVLIPVDFSDYSMRACEIGFEYAGKTGAEVMLLHVYYIPSSLSYLGIKHEKFDTEAVAAVHARVEADMLDLQSDIDRKIEAGELPGVMCNYAFREGLPEDEIIAFAKANRPVLIVMGTRGNNRKNIELIGSVTAEIIELTNVPLLAIPENITFRRFQDAEHIAFATSFNQHDLLAFEHFTQIIAGYQPQINLFNISTSRDEWNEIRLAGTREYLQKHYPSLTIDYTILDDMELLLAVEKFVHEKHIDVITLTTHRRSIITRLFNPSIARRMLFHTNTALLVIPEK
jgi:nucleotide-binding universal stress UspA family protein